MRAHADHIDAIITIAIHGDGCVLEFEAAVVQQEPDIIDRDPGQTELIGVLLAASDAGIGVVEVEIVNPRDTLERAPATLVDRVRDFRSDARRVGKEGVSTWRTRG